MSQIVHSHGQESDAIERFGVGIPLALTHHRGKSRVNQSASTMPKFSTLLNLNSLFLSHTQEDVICNAGDETVDCQPNQANLEITKQRTKHLYQEKEHIQTSCSALPSIHVLIVSGDIGAAHTLACKLRQQQPSLVIVCAHTAHSALVFVADIRPDMIIVELGHPSMDGKVIAGAIFVACPAAKPLMIAISGKESKEEKARLSKVFDHILRKPLGISMLTQLLKKTE